MTIDPINHPAVLNTQTDAVQPKTQQPMSEDDRKRAKLLKATQDFEGVFIGMMLKQMRKSMAGSSPLFGGSYEAKYYQEMVDEKVAQQMSKTGSFGLAKTLYKSMEHSLGLEKNTTPQTTGFDAGVAKISEAVKKMEEERDNAPHLLPADLPNAWTKKR